MKKRLELLWHRLINYKKKLTSQVEEEPPKYISKNELALRNVFSPININNKKNLKTNAFRPPSGSDEISINRINYTTVDFCRNLGLKDQNHTNDRSFFGFATISVNDIRESKADIVASPIKNFNPYHGDIKIGHKMILGEQPPSEIAEIIRSLTKKSILHIDPNPQSKNWEGNKIT